ncbi:MAG: hypothetical protein AAF518_00950 [Spirochaetota bacterium]
MQKFKDLAESLSLELIVDNGIPILRLWTDYRVEGMLQGFRVECYGETRGSGKSKSYYIIHRCYIPAGTLPKGFHLYRQGFWATLNVKFLGGQDIQVGTKEFDDKFIIRGESEREVKQFLHPANQEKISQLFTSYSEMQVFAANICYETTEFAHSSEDSRNILLEMAGFVYSLQTHPSSEDPFASQDRW